MVIPLSVPAILTVVIFIFTLTLQEFVYALTFVSAADRKPITLGVTTDLVRGGGAVLMSARCPVGFLLAALLGKAASDARAATAQGRWLVGVIIAARVDHHRAPLNVGHS
jgi:ABC-type spermidine/putrescine transport system permease subunit II